MEPVINKVNKQDKVEVDKVKKFSCLKNEIVLVKAVEENVATWVEKGKDGYLRLENTEVVYDAPLTSSGISQVLSEVERKELEHLMDSTRKQGWLSSYKREENVWRGKNRYKVIIPPAGISLALNKPIEFIKYKILLANTDDIAPSFETRLDRAYLFYMDFKSVMDRTKASRVDTKIEVAKYLSKLMSDDSKLRDVLLVLHRGDTRIIPKKVDLEAMKALLSDYVDKKTKVFLEIVKDPELKYKIMFYRGLENGVFVRNRGEYRWEHSGGKLIGNSIAEVIDFIKGLESNTDAQADYMTFKERINN